MKTLRFYGRSDDLLLCEVDGKVHAEAQALGRPAQFRIRAGAQVLRVVGTYSPDGASNGCWLVGFMQDAENAPVPAWPVAIGVAPAEGFPTPYTCSVLLTVLVPDEAVVAEHVES